MYFYRELASHVSLTSWRNSLFSPPPVSLVNRFTHHPSTYRSSKFRVKRNFLFFFYLLTLKFTPIFPLPPFLEILRSTIGQQ